MKKKIIGLLIAVFTFGMFLNVDAVTITTDSSKKGTTDTSSLLATNTGTITVSNVSSTDKLVAYKVLDVYYNSTSNVFTYEFTTSFKAFLASSTTYKNLTVEQYYALTSGDITSGSTRTQSTLDKLVSAYAAYVKTHSSTNSALTTTGTNATGSVAVGAYLVIPSITNNVFAVMVANVVPTPSGSTWAISNATIKAKVSSASLTKYIGSEGSKDGNYSVGEEFSYILVGTVPQFPTNATNTTYTINDTVGTGITLSALSTISIKYGSITLTNTNGTFKNSSGKTVATATITGQKLTIVFNVSYIDSTTVTVQYKAKLNAGAKLGDEGNLNSATLTYANDPYGTGTTTTAAVNVSAFTYGIEAFIYSDKDNSVKLSGVKFEVYSDSSLNTKVGEFTTDGNGRGSLAGVKAGTYYLKQVSTAAGYTLPKDAVPVKVKIPGATAGTVTGYYRADIAAYEAGSLPFTGGSGTSLFSLIGLLVIGASAVAIIVYRNKKEEVAE